ncbi:MAG: hypothetical protein ACR2LQ_04380 [Acidimicrobiales bacterium]
MLLRVLGAVAGISCLLGVAVEPAHAHGVDPTVKAVIDAVEPDVAGLVVQVADSVATELVLENPTAQPIEILADSGEAFLRIGPAGVEANLASPSWYLVNQPLGGKVPSGIDASSAPRWATVSDQPNWGWFDHRLHPAAVTDAEGDAHRAWTVPTRYAGQLGAIHGHLERRRFNGAYTSRLVSGATPLPGVSVQVLDGRVPGLLVRNTSAQPVIIGGAGGEPFARLGPGGAEVNRRSPTFVTNAQAKGEALDPNIAVDVAASPDWQLVSPEPAYAWIDERGRYPAEEPPEAAARSGVATIVLDWRIPMAAAATSVEIRAVTAWVPAPADAPAPKEGGGLPAAVVAALLTASIAALGVLLVFARRRSRRIAASRPSG